MKIVYQENEENKVLEFAADWEETFSIDLLAKVFVPVDYPFWIVTDAELESLKDIPTEAWEVTGAPDGIGGLTEAEGEEYKKKVEAFQHGHISK